MSSTLLVDPLRPTSLDDFLGQTQVVKELRIILNAANGRHEPAPHTLLSGPPGLGKTTLAAIIAAETGLDLVTITAAALDSPDALTKLLISLPGPSVVFIDEIHQLPRTVEETLYSAMEDQRIDVIIAAGKPHQRVIPIDVAPFTLIGATTRTGSLGAPFRDRFGYIARLRPYDHDTLTRIVARNAGLLEMTLTQQAAGAIAARSRGTPRIANRYLRRVRDYTHSPDSDDSIDARVAAAALDAFGIDHCGLSETDRDLLNALCVSYSGGPVGVSTLAAVIGETPATVEEVNEPYLMQIGFLARTPKGRVATPAAFTHLNLPVPTHLTSVLPGQLELVDQQPAERHPH